MRVGLNPNKNIVQTQLEYTHQVIMPVYIPNQEGYFKESFDTFQYSVESLLKTVHDKTYISIIDNGCCKIVRDYIDELYTTKKINEIVHTDNIGKVNAIIKGVVGHTFPLITITDSDVLFMTNWQNETYDILEAFPKAGVVGLTPTLNTSYYLTANVVFSNLLSKRIKFSKIINPDAMLNFYTSIGRAEDFDKVIDKRNLTLTNNDITACVGSGHYVATYKGHLFDNIQKFSTYKLGGDIEFQIDKLLLDKGYWRLTTHDNYAFHMGNFKEPWMQEELKKLSKSDITKDVSFNESRNVSQIEYFLIHKVFYKVITNRTLRKLFEKIKSE